jgi:hypothetical protein
LADCDLAVRRFIDAINEGNFGKASSALHTLARAVSVAGRVLVDWNRAND